MEPRMNDDLLMSKVDYQLLTGASGAIEASPEQAERLEEFTQRVGSGEFHVETDRTVICKCIDGRTCPHPTKGPNGAGGTLSIVVADDLTTKRLHGDTFSQSILSTAEVLRGENQSVGGHTSTHAAGEASGCGANDELPAIYDTIAQKADDIRTLTEQILGVAVDETTHRQIVTNADGRTEFGSGANNLQAMKSSGAEVEALEGGHNEVLAVINLRAGTTLDRDAVKAEFGDQYQAFNVDAWAFRESANKTSLTPEEVDQKVVAMTYYNLATALVLCGPTMRVTVLK